MYQLSRYLAYIRKTGDSVIVYDRDEPVATLARLQRDDSAEWRRIRDEAQARAAELGIAIELPVEAPAADALRGIATCWRRPAPSRTFVLLASMSTFVSQPRAKACPCSEP